MKIDDAIIEKYLKVANLAADGSSAGEGKAARETLKKLLDKYPRLPVEAARYLAAEEMRKAQELGKSMAREKANDLGRKYTASAPDALGDALRHLFTRTVDAVGEKLTKETQKAIDDFWDEFDPVNPLESIMGKKRNPYLNIPIEEALEELLENDAEDNDLGVEEDEETGQQFFRIELSIPIEMVEAIITSDDSKVALVDWLTQGLFDEDEDEDLDDDDADDSALEL